MGLEFTGEYFIPGKSPRSVEEDHIERYRFARQFVSDKTVLDIACGTGYGSNLLADSGASRVDGVDISEDVINYAISSYQADNLFFLKSRLCRYFNWLIDLGNVFKLLSTNISPIM